MKIWSQCKGPHHKYDVSGVPFYGPFFAYIMAEEYFLEEMYKVELN